MRASPPGAELRDATHGSGVAATGSCSWRPARAPRDERDIARPAGEAEESRVAGPAAAARTSAKPAAGIEQKGAADRQPGAWHTASTLLPSGSWTNAP